FVSDFDSQRDTLSQSSSFFKKVIPLGFSSKILLGKRGNTEASVLMRFAFAINDSMKDDFLEDRININNAYIELIPSYTYTDTLAPFDFSVHKINNNWSLTEFTGDSLDNLSYENDDLSSNKNFTDSLYTFNLDNDLISSWIKFSIDTSLGKNFGIYYKPDMGTGKIIGFEAFTFTSTDAAKLKVIVEKPGSYIDTISGFIFGDVSAVKTEDPMNTTGKIVVQASSTLQSKLFFDLSTIPKNIIINRADLIIQEDTLNSVIGTGFGTNLSVYMITDADSNIVDESSGVILAESANVFSANITDIINFWYSGGENSGMIIRSASIIDGLNLIALKGSGYQVESERPRLKIVYTSREN
ncbi:hypothetical protein ACFLSS_01120, partial [Bacteroidota bacterium]